MAENISRADYARQYGPTTGDRVRLGDTELWMVIESDMTVYGEEVMFGLSNKQYFEIREPCKSEFKILFGRLVIF